MIQIPDRLNFGDTVGIVAPSGGFDRRKFEAGIEMIRSMGFQVRFPENFFDFHGYLSAPDKVRAAQFHAYFADPEIKAVLCARGGYGAIRILNRLDLDMIRRNAKIFMGFSDVTALLSVLSAECRMGVFHGPMAATLADLDAASLYCMQEALTFSDRLVLSLDGCRVVRPGRAAGPVAGGNLTTLCHLMGTPFEPDFRGKILFLEDTGEAPYRIDRMLNHLKLAGSFKDIQCLILGSFDGCGDYADIVALAEDLLEETHIPVVADFPAGHGGRNVTLPMGLPAVLDTDHQTVFFER